MHTFEIEGGVTGDSPRPVEAAIQASCAGVFLTTPTIVSQAPGARGAPSFSRCPTASVPGQNCSAIASLMIADPEFAAIIRLLKIATPHHLYAESLEKTSADRLSSRGRHSVWIERSSFDAEGVLRCLAAKRIDRTETNTLDTWQRA